MRTGQYDDKVDLYSGQASFPVVIAERKGRNGLDLALRINYNSRTVSGAAAWNLERPAGILGLGWSLPPDTIFVDLHGSAGMAGRSFYISTGGTLNELVCVGEKDDRSLEFKTADYRFWKILYDPPQEKWTIIKENGDIHTYGDISCGRNAVQWGVKHGNWLGDSSLMDGQERIAVAWNLNAVSNRFHDQLLYSYQQVLRATGTAQGLAYTQSIYLDSITGVNGEMIKLHYKPKDPDEYQEAHTSPPAPNAYQDRVETQYLDTVEEMSADGTVLVTHQFTYAFIGSGAFKKRLLTSITDRYANNRSLPATLFAYFGQDSADGVNRDTVYNQATGALYGALKSVTLPEGGVVSYRYQGLEAGCSGRSLSIAPPAAAGVAYSRPRWYFANDYAAVTWLGSNNTMALQTYTWDGRWLKWEYRDIPVAGASAYDSVMAAVQDEFLVLYTGARLYPLYKNRAKRGEWIQPAVSSGAATVPYYAPEYGDERVILAAGTRFCALMGTGSGKLNRYTFTAAGWTSEGPVSLNGGSQALYAVAARHNFLLAACCPDSGKKLGLYLYFLDAAGTWQSTGVTQSIELAAVTGIAVQAEDAYAAIQAVMGKGGDSTVQYMACLWDEAFSKLQTRTFCLQSYPAGQAVVDLKVKGSLVGIGQKMYRYNGREWIYSDLTDPDQVQAISLDLGYDEMARIIKTSAASPYTYDIVQYNADSQTWETPPNLHSRQAAAGMACRLAVTKEQGSNYAVYRNKIYYRQPDRTWAEILTIPDPLTDEDIPTVQVEQSRYLAYQSQTGTGNVKTVVYPVRNGAVGNTPLVLTGEKIYTEAGVSLLGGNSFISYSGAYDGATGGMTLRRVITEKCGDAQTVYAVKTISAYNGYTTRITGFVYDTSSAAVDAGGYVPRFNKVTVIPGAAGLADAANGYTETYFFNGLTSAEAPALPYPADSTTNTAAYYSIVQGSEYAWRVYRTGSGSAETVASGTNFWWFSETMLGNVSKGFYLRQKKETETRDGVSKNRLMDYSADTGLLVQVTDENYDFNGRQQQYIRQFTYWWELYDQSRRANMLTPIVKTWQKIKQAAGGAERTRSIVINTWREDWGHGPGQWAPHKWYRALNANPSPFNSWQTGSAEPEADWLKEDTVLSRSASGQVLEQAAADNRKTSLIYTADECRTVARAINAAASGDELTYLGFEAYENLHAWAWNEPGGSLGDNLTTIDYHTGSRCLKLKPSPGAKTGCCKIIQPVNQEQIYVFALWARLENDFNPAQGKAQFEISFYKAADDTAVGDPLLIDLSAALKNWSYFIKAIDLVKVKKDHHVPADTALYFKILGYNQNSAKYCLVDNFRFSPAAALFSATVYDAADYKILALLDNNNQATQTVPNCFNAPAATRGPLGRVTSLSVHTYARTLFSSGSFHASYPNSIVRLGSSCDSFFFDFHDGSLDGWEFSDNNWSIAKGELTYGGTSADPLGSKATMAKVAYTNFAARAKVVRKATPLPDVAMGNEHYFVQWIESTRQWKLVQKQADNRLVDIAVNSAVDFKEEWLYLVVDGFIMFFADGVQLFNHTYQYPKPVPEKYGKLTLCLNKPGGFDDVALLQEPQLSITFRDGLGESMQTLYLEGKEVAGAFKEQYLVTNEGAFYDNLGRIQHSRNPAAAQVLMAAPQTGDGGNDLAPRLLLGDQDTYLFNANGQHLTRQQYLDAPVKNYRTSRYEASPLNRLAGVVLPRGGSDPADCFTVTVQYNGSPSPTAAGSDSNSGDAGNKYFVQKVARVQAATKSGAAVTTEKITVRDMQGSIITILEGKSGGPYLTRGYDYNLYDNKTTVYQPNYFNPPAGSEAAVWKESLEYTFNGLLKKKTAPDRGSATYMYDAANRLRFTQDAEGRSLTPQRIVYYKYDGAGRVTETGYIQDANYPWSDQGKLQQKANVPDFPVTDASQSADPNYAAGKWRAKNDYDLDADSVDSPYSLGRVTRVQVNNGAQPDSTRYQYDAYGNMTKSAHTVKGYGDAVNEFLYGYNNQNQLRTITYPVKDSRGNSIKVGYTYDRMGRLASVGLPFDGTGVVDPSNPPKSIEACYAFYQYDFYGRLASEKINAGTNPDLDNSSTRTYSYNEAGYLAAMDDDYCREALDYFTEGGYDGTKYYNGSIAGTEFAYKTDNRQSYTSLYQYDAYNRLTAGVHSLKDAWSLNPCAAPYDDNGNIIRSMPGVTLKQYNYVQSGSKRINNQLRDITGTVNTGMDFEGLDPGDRRSGNWSWGSNNGGPSASGVATSDRHTGAQCLKLAGGSLAHYEYLIFQSYLDPGAVYSLNCWIKTAADFSAGAGDAAWFLVIGTASGKVIEKKLASINQAGVWTQNSIQVDMKSLLTDIKEPVGYIELELRNYKRNPADAGPGPLLLIDDITLSGSATGGAYAYNLNGAIVSSPAKNISSIVYDPVSNLPAQLQMTNAQGNKLLFNYGENNQRVYEKYQTGDGSSVFLEKLYLHGLHSYPLVEKTRINGTERAICYLYGLHNMLAYLDAGKYYYPLKDYIGSTRLVMDEDHAVVSRFDYLPYGQMMRQAGGRPAAYLYTGQEFDDVSGLYNCRARLYDPDLGRFYQTDPAGQYPSPYTYVGNDPVNYVDPSGERGGPPVGVLSICTNVVNEDLTAGHAWLMYTFANRTRTTYGTWGNREPLGLHRDIELRDTPVAIRNIYLDADDYNALQAFAADNSYWWFINNCASFAARAWYNVTGELLSYTWWGIPNPSSLGAGIIAANGNVTNVTVILPTNTTDTGPSISGGSATGSLINVAGGRLAGFSGNTFGSFLGTLANRIWYEGAWYEEL